MIHWSNIDQTRFLGFIEPCGTQISINARFPWPNTHADMIAGICRDLRQVYQDRCPMQGTHLRLEWCRDCHRPSLPKTSFSVLHRLRATSTRPAVADPTVLVLESKAIDFSRIGLRVLASWNPAYSGSSMGEAVFLRTRTGLRPCKINLNPPRWFIKTCHAGAKTQIAGNWHHTPVPRLTWMMVACVRVSF